MQYRLRTLLIVLALGPVVLWAVWVLWPPHKAEPRFSGIDIQYFHRQISDSANEFP